MTHWPRSWDYPEDNEDDEMDSMSPEQMIHRLRDMGRYWDDGKPQPNECADMIEEMYDILREFESTGYINRAKVRKALDHAEGRS